MQYAAMMCVLALYLGAQLERIWGPGDGRPVREMKVSNFFSVYLLFYLLSLRHVVCFRLVLTLSL